MSDIFHQQVLPEVRRLLYEDSQRSAPVVQSISLFFWQNLERWFHRVALAPRPFTIALAGASGSGKSFIREVLENSLGDVTGISSFTQDNYYRDFEADFPHLSLASFYDEIDFDDPVHIRFDKLAQDLHRLKDLSYGATLHIPRLRFGTPAAKPTIIERGMAVRVEPFIVTEGIFAFYDRSLTHLYDFKIFVDIDEGRRRQRWLERNRRENRGTTDNMWNTTVRCLNEHILPSREVADMVIDNSVSQADVSRFVEAFIQALAAIARRQRETAA